MTVSYTVLSNELLDNSHQERCLAIRDVYLGAVSVLGQDSSRKNTPVRRFPTCWLK
ncbi:protein of unknown function [Candidatus Nitrosotalea okcheonensis]|uniref:Uncharacterized protein n=1 Tax=Candidatus Nitrosotalea okcheonensis TaxID=1903276 RepID=A0A2H1FFC6_9ARCH|nr:protein of unknown function [Candidatus Nitrosotalea okcheonensis]